MQEAVKLRLQALGVEDEDSTADEDDEAPRGAAARRKPKKSGRKRTVADRVKVPVKWPHYHTYRGPGKDMAAYDDLTVTEFVHGFFTTLLASRPDAGNQAIRLRHLQHLMLDATDFGWEAARHAHGVSNAVKSILASSKDNESMCKQALWLAPAPPCLHTKSPKA